mgnify:CR=1 FL=1
MELLPTLYQDFIHLSRYSRWVEEEGRRETWEETINRYFDFFVWHLNEYHSYKVDNKERKELEEAVINLEIMPSMRALLQDIIVRILVLAEFVLLMRFYIF